MKLSLVVPCFNEEGNVPLFYEAVKADFASVSFDYEIVFVNDGSADGTLAELKKLLGEAIPVRIVSFSRNFGKEAAIFAGLKESTGDYVTVIDADLQQRPSIALEMVRMLDENPETDCIAAYQENRKESGLLVFFKKAFYGIINKFSDTEFVQGASDFRTFRRKMVDAVIETGEYFRFSKGLFSWVGFNTEYVPYVVEERATGSSKWSFRKLFRYAVDGIEAFSTVPLKLSLFAGFALLAASLIYVIVKIILRFSALVPWTEASWIIFLLLLIGGAVLVSAGIIGEYLAKVYVQTKGRPIYIAKEILTNKRSDSDG